MPLLRIEGSVSDAPFASRPFGWCQDYGPGHRPQHEKCDGALGVTGGKNYLCPCSCHVEVEMDAGPWTLDLPMTRPLSMNDRSHWRARADEIATVRQATLVLAKQAKIPPLGRCRVTLVYEPRDNRRRDQINLAATLKPVQDGLVDAGVVADDTPELMESPMPIIDLPSGGRTGKLWVLVEAVR
jgi:crossover junction endodeoxyribonuclease RusA